MNLDVDAASVRDAVDVMMSAAREIPVVYDIVALSAIGVVALAAVAGTVAGIRRRKRRRRPDLGPTIRTSPFAGSLADAQLEQRRPLSLPMQNPWSG